MVGPCNPQSLIAILCIIALIKIRSTVPYRECTWLGRRLAGDEAVFFFL
jgi:hypothetical protein